MIDTEGYASPDVSEDLAAQIQSGCHRLSRMDCSTGALLWDLTTGSLEGSYDSRISVRIDREPVRTRDALGKVISVSYGPRLMVEGSPHKAIMGHNVYGGPLDPVQAGRYLIDQVAQRLDVELPDAREWTVRRVDVAEVFDLGSKAACDEWFWGMRNVTFPRRQAKLYPGGLYFAGSQMTTKAYHKGSEFVKHDRARLARFEPLPFDLHELRELADRYIRVEVEIRKSKLVHDFGDVVKLGQLTSEYVEAIWDIEVGRLIKETESEMNIVRTHLEVKRRLEETYSGELAGRLFGTWMQLAALGEDVVKAGMARRSWFRQRRQLIDAHVTWHGADVRIVPTLSALPADFSILRSSRYRLADQASEVTEALRRFAA